MSTDDAAGAHLVDAHDAHDAMLRRAIVLAAESRAAGDHPFGALLCVGGDVIAEARNLVNTTLDITAHAETVLVRILEERGQLGLLAEGIVYASCEPCPMCVGALFWAGARHVVFGMSAAKLGEVSTGPGELLMGFTVTAAEIGSQAVPAMRVDGPLMEADAVLGHHGYWF